MTELSGPEITVRGEFTAFHPPERATVTVTVGFDGPRADEVYGATTAGVAAVQQSIVALHDPNDGPVTWYSTDQVRTGAHRPWNDKGVQLPVVHTARATIQAKFSDFAALGHWLGGAAEQRGVTIGGIEWALTAARRTAVVRDVRAAAVNDAVERAQAYAEALGLGPVRAVAIADAGMLGDGLNPSQLQQAAFSRAKSPSGGDVEFVPQDVRTDASVDARFVVTATAAPVDPLPRAR